MSGCLLDVNVLLAWLRTPIWSKLFEYAAWMSLLRCPREWAGGTTTTSSDGLVFQCFSISVFQSSAFQLFFSEPPLGLEIVLKWL